MLALLLTTTTHALGVVAPVRAVDVPAIATAAELEHTSADVGDALNLPEIVHSRARPPGTRPARRTRATTLSSNASTRGDPGLGASDSGPFSLVTVVPIVRRRRVQGQLPDQIGPLRFPRF